MYRRNGAYRHRSRLLLVTLSTILFRSSSGFPYSFPSCSILSKNVVASACGSKVSSVLHPENQFYPAPPSVLRRSYITMTSDDTDKNIPMDTTTVTSTSTVPIDKNVIDKSLFDQNIQLVALNIPAKLCTEYMKTFKDHLLKRPRMKRIFDAVKDGVKDDARRLIILSEENGNDLFLTKIPEDMKEYNKNHGGIPEIYTLKICYDDIAVDEVLRKVLPENVLEIPSSFEQVGHIAHLNLREEVLQYKYLIGDYFIHCCYFN